MKQKLTRTFVDKLRPKPGKQFIVWDSLDGFGVVVSPGGTKRFIAYGRVGGYGNSVKIGLGKHPVTTPETARTSAMEILAQMERGIDPRAKKERRTLVTFGELMEAYAGHLENLGKPSAQAVKTAIHRHISKHSKYWLKPAVEITLDDCMTIVRQVKDQGKLRQADLIRSYIKSAFSKAINAKGDVNAPQAMLDAQISVNPAGELSRVEGSTGTRDRVLTETELRHYWRRVNEQQEPRKSILMLHLLSGGQRQKQLVRVKVDDIDRDDRLMTLLDNKGRRNKPRKHIVPLLPKAIECIDNLALVGPWIFSANGGRSPINTSYFVVAVRQICEAMEKAGELEKGSFTAGSLRATVETRLAARKVSGDVLAQLLSHGLGGVQNKHYQRHEYLEEKLAALQSLQRILEVRKAIVTPLRAAQ